MGSGLDLRHWWSRLRELRHRRQQLPGVGINPLFANGDDDTVWGWTIGAGVEWAFTNNLTARLEYRYTSFDRDNNTFFVNPALRQRRQRRLPRRPSRRVLQVRHLLSRPARNCKGPVATPGLFSLELESFSDGRRASLTRQPWAERPPRPSSSGEREKDPRIDFRMRRGNRGSRDDSGVLRGLRSSGRAARAR